MKAVVDGKRGIILLPDDWDASIYVLNNPNNSLQSFNDNTINMVDWNQYFAINGAVFLPAAGHRDVLSVMDCGLVVDYWSATFKDNSGAYNECFNDTGVYTYMYSRHIGRSVRLVQDYQR